MKYTQDLDKSAEGGEIVFLSNNIFSSYKNVS